MTTVTNLASGGNKLYDEDLTALATASLGAHSSTQFVLNGGADFSVTLSGTGLTYSGGHVSGGTITSLALVNTSGTGRPTQTWSGFSLSAATVWNAVTAHDSATLNNLFFGGNDTFTTTTTSVILDGLGGDDTFNVSMPAGDMWTPTIDGGDGIDTVNLNCTLPNNQYNNSNGLFPITSMLKNVERINLAAGHSYKLTTYYSNALVSPGANLKIDGSALTAADVFTFDGSSETDGTFELLGGAGNDTFRGGSGNDIFDGGAGSDTVDFNSAQVGSVVIDLRLTTPQNAGNAGHDTLRNIENIIGSGTLTGTDGANTFVITGGTNIIDGGAGSDTLDCRNMYSATVDLSKTDQQRIDNTMGTYATLTSIENVIGSGQGDLFIGNAGDNTFDGRGGTDRVSLADSTTAVTVDCRSGSPVITGATGIGNDTYISIESFVGTNFDDTFIANTDYATKPMTFDGGAGKDTIDFSYMTSGAYYDPIQSSTTSNFERAIGSNYNDTLIADTVIGNDGNDTLTGTTMSGGAGDDTFWILQSSDGKKTFTIDGGSGNDTAYLMDVYRWYISEPPTVFAPDTLRNVETLLLNSGSVVNLQFNDANVAAGATLTIRRRSDSGTWLNGGDIRIDGSAETDGNFNITTRDGNDVLIGGAGNDTFVSAGGNDTLTGGAGNDTLDGGDGIDTASYADATSGVTVNLALAGMQAVGGGQGSDTLTAVENLTGSAYGDTLIGDAANNTLSGSDGADALSGGAGDDTLDGGNGSDTASYADATSGVTVSLALTAAQAVGGGQGSDTLTSIENLAGSAYGDTLIGDAGNNILSGGGGADTLNGGGGNDTLDGGGGFDTVDYRSSTGVTVNLAAGTASGSGIGSDTLLNVENVIGGSGSDTLTGDAGGNVLSGGAGNDTLDGGAGADTADYSSDTAGVIANLTTGTATGSACGSDTLINIEYLTGGSGNDTLTGTDADNVLRGGAGNDTLSGGNGFDSAAFSGAMSSYTVTDTGGGNYTVSGPDGTDQLSGVEELLFGDVAEELGPRNLSVGGDFDGSGHADVLVQSAGGQPGVWIMSGTQLLYGATVGTNPGGSCKVIGTGDFNNDGKADVVLQYDNGAVAVWLMNGLNLLYGTWAGSNPGSSWQVISTGDFNGDGKSDLLLQNRSGQAAVWLMDGTNLLYGTLAGTNQGPTWKVIGSGDFNGDGKADILWQNIDGRAAVWLMDGANLLYGMGLGTLGSDWKIVGAGDFNGDGKSDILWRSLDGEAQVWLMDGTDLLGSQNLGGPSGAGWKVIGAQDVNGDGKSDILWQNLAGQTAAWLMDGTTAYYKGTVSSTASSWYAISDTGGQHGQAVKNDFNGNKMADIVLQNVNGQAAVWLMDGTTMLYGTQVGTNPGAGWKLIGAGDFNGDGKADILWQSPDQQAAVWLMDGTNLLYGTYVSGAGAMANASVVGAADFNGDGKSDILWQSASGQAAVWLMDGTSVIYGTWAGSNPGADSKLVGTGDFNGDGKADILWQAPQGQAAVWLMDGTDLIYGTFADSAPNTDLRLVGTGDFNADGKSDLLWQNKTTGQAAIWLMDGTDPLSKANVASSPGASWKLMGTADYNGDGRADLIWQDSTTGQVAAWLMKGTSVLSTANIGSPNTAWTVVAGTAG